MKGMGRLREMKDSEADISIPDASILWRTVKGITEWAIANDEQLAHLVRNVRDTLSIDNRPTQLSVSKVHQLILSETDSRADKEVVKDK